MNAFGISLAKEIKQIIATLEMIREMGWDGLQEQTQSHRNIDRVFGSTPTQITPPFMANPGLLIVTVSEVN